jgi:hypothetical protein
MRDLHARMLAALLAGEGLRGIAELAAEEAGGPVAIVLPARGLADASSRDAGLEELSEFAADRLRGEAPQIPERVELEREVTAGEQGIGYVLALRGATNGLPAVAVDREEVLRTTALAALAEVAAPRRDEADEPAACSRICAGAEVRYRPPSCAAGCDLSRAAVVAEARSSRPRHAAA